MRYFSLLWLATLLFVLAGCSLLKPDVDKLAPMVAATEQPAANHNPLFNNMQEPSPATTAAATAAPVTNLWVRLRRGFKLDKSLDNAKIRHYRDWYQRHDDYLERVALRSKRYLYYIVQQAEKRDMPLELALLPVVESAFDPFAYSRSHASGLWQFIPSTGRYFNLKQNWWYDARRDVLLSTQAALDYLQKLSKRFDDNWLLALASYNAGAGRVSRAMRRNKQRGLPTDFWHLDLPNETSAYVPKLIAVAQLIADPQKYGLSLPPISNQPYFSVVETGGQIDLQKAAKMAKVSIEELYMLNPAPNHWATPPNGPHRLLLPLQKAQGFEAALAALPADERINWARYQIRPGDSLIAISQRLQVPLSTLRRINQIKGSSIIAGDTLLVPASHGNNSYASALKKTLIAHNQPSGRRYLMYRVRSGDNLWDIAQSHDVSLSELLAWNGLSRSSTLRPGQRLKIWTNGRPLSAQASYHYDIKQGDSLWSIAQAHNVSLSQLMAWNGLSKSSVLQPGQRLTLRGEAPVALNASGQYEVRSGDSLWSIAQSLDISLKQLMTWNNLNKSSVLQPGQTLVVKDEPQPLTYSVRSGDSLYAIASRYDVSVDAIRRWNNIEPGSYLHPEQQLTLYVNPGQLN